MCSLALPHTPLTGSMSCCLGIGRLFNSKALRCRWLDGARQQSQPRVHPRPCRRDAWRRRGMAVRGRRGNGHRCGQLWIVGVGEDGAMAFTDDGIENLKNLIAIHKDDPSIIEERRQALATMIKPKTQESDEVPLTGQIS